MGNFHGPCELNGANSTLIKMQQQSGKYRERMAAQQSIARQQCKIMTLRLNQQHFVKWIAVCNWINQPRCGIVR